MRDTIILMEPQLSLSYNWTESLYILFVLSHEYKEPTYRKWLVHRYNYFFPDVAIILIAILATSDNTVTQWLISVLLGILLPIILGLFMSYPLSIKSAKRTYNKFKTMKDVGITIDLNSSHLTYKGQYGEDRIPYSSFTLILQNEKCYLLYADLFIVMLPKEYCTNEMEKFILSKKNEFDIPYELYV